MNANEREFSEHHSRNADFRIQIILLRVDSRSEYPSNIDHLIALSPRWIG